MRRSSRDASISHKYTFYGLQLGLQLTAECLQINSLCFTFPPLRRPAVMDWADLRTIFLDGLDFFVRLRCKAPEKGKKKKKKSGAVVPPHLPPLPLISLPVCTLPAISPLMKLNLAC